MKIVFKVKTSLLYIFLVAFHGYVWPFANQYDLVWPFMDLYSILWLLLWSCMAFYAFLWSCMAVLWSFMAFYGKFSISLDLYLFFSRSQIQIHLVLLRVIFSDFGIPQGLGITKIPYSKILQKYQHFLSCHDWSLISTAL